MKLRSLPAKVARKLLRLTEDFELGRPAQSRRWSTDCFATIEVLKRHSPSSLHTLYDIGSNQGTWTRVFSSFFPELQRAYLFEPMAAFRLASEDLELPGVELEVVPVGLGSANEERILSGSGPSASLLPFTDLQNRYFPGSVDFSTRTVQVETLDSWVERREAPRPDVIKIDVQGEELSVLGGAGKTLSHCRWLIVEMSTVVLYDGQGLSGSVLSHLEASGWRFVDFGYQWRSSDQRLLQFDAILTRDDSN